MLSLLSLSLRSPPHRVLPKMSSLAKRKPGTCPSTTRSPSCSANSGAGRGCVDLVNVPFLAAVAPSTAEFGLAFPGAPGARRTHPARRVGSFRSFILTCAWMLAAPAVVRGKVAPICLCFVLLYAPGVRRFAGVGARTVCTSPR